jgi:hypothetical protein
MRSIAARHMIPTGVFPQYLQPHTWMRHNGQNDVPVTCEAFDDFGFLSATCIRVCVSRCALWWCEWVREFRYYSFYLKS